MKIKKLKIKLNKDNEYSDYRYFIPKSNNIKMTDGRDVDEAVQSLKDKIANLKEQANYLINKAPLVKYAEGASIILTDCAEAPLRKLTIEGNSKQETRSGKNLCKLADKTDTSNGITSVITDGVVSVNGTATSTWFNLTTNQSFKLNAGTYTVSVNKALTQFGIDFYDSSGTVFSLAKNLTSAKITLSSEKIITRLVGVVANGEVLNIDGLTFQIEEGSVATEYEQYGASPSIEHEAPIESVGDNINEFDLEKYPFVMKVAYNSKGETLSWEGYCGIQEYVPVEENTQYTFSNNLGLPFVYGLVFYDVSKNVISAIVGETRTFTTPEKCKYIRFAIQSSTLPTWVKICKGTLTGAYSPYGQGSIEIYSCNKNLFNKNTIRERHRLSSDGADYSDINYFVSDYIAIKENIKCVKNTPIGIYYAVSYYDKDKKHIARNTTENPFVTPEGTCYMRVCDLLTNLDTLQLEKGETVTEYVEHQSQTKALYTQQPFRAIGDVKDRFVKKAGVWYEEHNIARKILNGSETTWYLTVSNEAYCFWFRNNTIENCLLAKHKKYCNYFQYEETGFETATNPSLCENSASYNEHNFMFVFKTDGTLGKTVDEWKAKLTELYNTGTPVYVDYVLETPILIPCVLEQVEVLDNLQSYDKITYYNVDKINNVQANIKLIYKQDINAILEGEGV